MNMNADQPSWQLVAVYLVLAFIAGLNAYRAGKAGRFAYLFRPIERANKPVSFAIQYWFFWSGCLLLAVMAVVTAAKLILI
jgi:hypothetical protein